MVKWNYFKSKKLFVFTTIFLTFLILTACENSLESDDQSSSGPTYGDTIDITDYEWSPTQPEGGEQARLDIFYIRDWVDDANRRVVRVMLFLHGSTIPFYESEFVRNSYPVLSDGVSYPIGTEQYTMWSIVVPNGRTIESMTVSLHRINDYGAINIPGLDQVTIVF
jgi:hypothetical protein